MFSVTATVLGVIYNKVVSFTDNKGIELVSLWVQRSCLSLMLYVKATHTLYPPILHKKNYDTILSSNSLFTPTNDGLRSSMLAIIIPPGTTPQPFCLLRCRPLKTAYFSPSLTKSSRFNTKQPSWQTWANKPWQRWTMGSSLENKLIRLGNIENKTIAVDEAVSYNNYFPEMINDTK